MQIVQVEIKDLKEAPYNPRLATEKDYEDLKESIKKYGLVDPIIVNGAEGRKNIVIGGHFRLRVARDMGMETVPVYYVNIPNEDDEKELNIRLNKNTGRWDFDLLSSNFDTDLLLGFGFTEGELGIGSTGDAKDQIDKDVLDKDLDTYLDGNIRQIVLYFKKEQFDVVMPKMEKLMETFQVENHTEVFLKLLEYYENSTTAKKSS